MELSQTTKDQIAAEAVDWFLRLQNEAPAAADRQSFSEWLLRSPAHIEEYLAVSSAWVGLGGACEADSSADSLIEAARRAEPSNVLTIGTRETFIGQSHPRQKDRFGRAGWVGLAASVVLALGGLLAYQSWQHQPDFKTAIGEQRSVTLSDGSLVFLNTNSEIRPRWTQAERRIDLIRGEARFQVEKDGVRPFLVFTSDAKVRALGTIFNVRADRAGTAVAVIEGRVNVSVLAPPLRLDGDSFKPDFESSAGLPAAGTPPTSIELSTGQRAAVASNRILPNAGPPIESISAWTDRRLVFRGESLTTVVAEFNRYRVQPIVIDDDQLAGLKISGVFASTDPESLVAYLKSFETVRVNQLADGSLHLSRSTPN
jgi:transmembrane sensor